MNIGELIKTERKIANLTQQELADKLRLSSKARIYEYESGRVIPPIQILEKMAKIFGGELKIAITKTQ